MFLLFISIGCTLQYEGEPYHVKEENTEKKPIKYNKKIK